MYKYCNDYGYRPYGLPHLPFSDSYSIPIPIEALKLKTEYPRLLTNFDIEKIEIYKKAIAAYEIRYPEHKGVFYISDNPEDVVDIFNITLDLNKHRALMQAVKCEVGYDEFWSIFWSIYDKNKK